MWFGFLVPFHVRVQFSKKRCYLFEFLVQIEVQLAQLGTNVSVSMIKLTNNQVLVVITSSK